MWRWALIAALIGCGRVGFQETSDDATPVDAMTTEDSAADATPLCASGLAERVIVHYAFESLASGRVADNGPNGIDANCRDGSCPTISVGVVGQGYSFEGEQFAVAPLTAAEVPLFAPAEGLTIAAFINLDDVDGLRTVVSKLAGEANSNTFNFHATEGTDFQFNIGDAVEDLEFPLANVVRPGVWIHVAGSFRPISDGGDGLLRLYIDGSEVGSSSDSATRFVSDAGGLFIGADNDFGAEADFFSGGMDELYLFRGALTPAEVSELAECGQT